MSRYIRPRVQGASVFFTVALCNRHSRLLVEEVAALRDAVRITRKERPFQIEAWVVLPDHLHALWTLPEGDADYSTRWRLIKARFSRGLPAGPLRLGHQFRQSAGCGSAGSGSVTSGTMRILPHICAIAGGIRSSMGWSRSRRIGGIHPCTAISGKADTDGDGRGPCFCNGSARRVRDFTHHELK